MDSLVKLIVGIAWPVAVVWVAYLFKGELRSLMHRISQIKYKDAEANFASDLAQAETKALSIPQVPANAPQSEISSKLDSLRRIADVSPRAAIMEAWVLVEDSAAKSGHVQGTAVPRVNARSFVEDLISRGKLPAESGPLIDQMRKLRNQATHLPDFVISHDEADRYLQLAAKISELIIYAES